MPALAPAHISTQLACRWFNRLGENLARIESAKVFAQDQKRPRPRLHPCSKEITIAVVLQCNGQGMSLLQLKALGCLHGRAALSTYVCI